jgi:hypothetical protein
MQLQIYRDGRVGQSFVLHLFYRLNGYVYAEIPPHLNISRRLPEPHQPLFHALEPYI